MIEMTHRGVCPMNPPEYAPESGTVPLLVCQYCGFVRDEQSRQRDQIPVWIPMKAYRENNKVRLSEIPFVHIYCPDCSRRLGPKHSEHSTQRCHEYCHQDSHA